MKLYNNLLKVTFFKSKETKWIVCISAFIITLISMLMASAQSITDSYVDAINDTAQYDFALNGLDESKMDKYFNMDYWNNSVASIACSTNSFELDLPESQFYFSVTGLAGEYKELYKLKLTEGSYPSNENEIVVDSKFMDNSAGKYKLGDEIVFSIYSSVGSACDVSYTICGVFETAHTTGAEVYGFCTIEGAKRALIKSGQETAYRVTFTTADRDIESIAAATIYIDDIDKENLSFNDSRLELIEDQTSDSGQFIQIFKLLGAFIGLVSAFLLYNMLQISVGNKIQQIGIVRSIGLRSKQLICTYIVNLALYIAFSILIAFPITVTVEKTIGKILFSNFMNGYNFSEYAKMSFHFSIKAFLLAVGLITLIFIIVFAGVLIKALKLSPLESVRYVGENKRTGKVRKINLNKVNAISLVGNRNLSRNKIRTINTGFSFFISSVLLLTVLVVSVNINLFDMDKLEKSNNYDFEFYSTSNESQITAELMNTLLELDSVKNISWERNITYEFWTSEQNIGIYNDDAMVTTRAYCDSVFKKICESNNLDYSKLNKEPCYLLLKGTYSESIELYNINGKINNVNLETSIDKDIYSDYDLPGTCIVMNEKAAKELFGDDFNYSGLLIKANNKKSCESDVLEMLNANGIDITYNDLEDNTADAKMQLRSILCIIVYVLFCVGIMTIINIICNVNINVQQRKREYGILIALGMTRKQIVRLIISEITILAEKMLILAIPFAGVISMYFIIGAEQEVNIVKSLITAVLTLGGIYVFTYLLCYFRGNKLFSSNVLKLLENE